MKSVFRGLKKRCKAKKKSNKVTNGTADTGDDVVDIRAKGGKNEPSYISNKVHNIKLNRVNRPKNKKSKNRVNLDNSTIRGLN